MVRYCTVYGCSQSNNNKLNTNVRFFCFPSDEVRCKHWIKAIGRNDLENKSVNTLHSSYFVCHLHFVRSDFLKRNLKKYAVPTLLLPQLEDPNSNSKYTQTDIELTHSSVQFDDEIPNTKHDGVTCAFCSSDIVGNRYICLQCLRVDLCSSCEAEDFHSQHVILRLPNPRLYEVVLSCLEPVKKALHLALTESSLETSTSSPIESGVSTQRNEESLLVLRNPKSPGKKRTKNVKGEYHKKIKFSEVDNGCATVSTEISSDITIEDKSNIIKENKSDITFEDKIDILKENESDFTIEDKIDILKENESDITIIDKNNLEFCLATVKTEFLQLEQHNLEEIVNSHETTRAEQESSTEHATNFTTEKYIKKEVKIEREELDNYENTYE